MSAPIDAWQEVLDFWFGAPGSPEFNTERNLWFTKSAATDQAIEHAFGALHARAIGGQLNAWAEAPASACALIVLLDQFSRNLYRDDARAFAGDARLLRWRGAWWIPAPSVDCRRSNRQEWCMRVGRHDQAASA